MAVALIRACKHLIKWQAASLKHDDGGILFFTSVLRHANHKVLKKTYLDQKERMPPQLAIKEQDLFPAKRI